VGAEFAYESRNADEWTQQATDDPDLFGDIYRTVNHPTESRWRLKLGMDWSVVPGTLWQPRLAVEYVENEAFVLSSAVNYMVELALRVRLKPGP
jgi:hypothetical protein